MRRESLEKLWDAWERLKTLEPGKDKKASSVPASERPGFAKLIDRLEAEDILIVTKLDRLGRNAMDVRATVERLAETGVRVHCLALGGWTLPAQPAR